jgi:prokaryotic ubiquitin-like protein Pup
MAEQEHKQRPTQAKTEAESTQPPPSTAESDKIKADLDSLLDEIDEVLEGNAEEFVRNYVQKGGE